jgi:hypothetical protein
MVRLRDANTGNVFDTGRPDLTEAEFVEIVTPVGIMDLASTFPTVFDYEPEQLSTERGN